MRGSAAPGHLASLISVISLVLCARGCVQHQPPAPATADRRPATAPQVMAVRPTPVAPPRPSSPSPTARAFVEDAPATAPASQPSTQASDDPVARIRDEGMNRSQVMQTASYLMDVIGPRLTGSPNLRRANDWTRERLESWGLVNGHLEPWGKFGRGWSLKRFSAQVVEPQTILLIGCPKAWSPGLAEPIVADVAYLDASNDAEFEKYRGQLKGKIVLTGQVREVQARFDPPALRASDSTLLQLANAAEGTAPRPGEARGATAAERRATFAATPAGRALINRSTTAPSTEPTTTPTTSTTGPTSRPSTRPSPARTLAFLAEEGAAVVVTPSSQGDGGTFFIGSASIPGVERDPTAGTGANRRGPKPWDLDPPPLPPQVTLAVEDFNRIVRMTRQGESLKMAVDLQVQFHDEDPMAYNTVAEIPGTDLKEEIVMIGAHLDSWHAGTGATDNGAGVAATMEAVRILKALGLQPRRTVRIALWTGEEQGIYGSKGYVKEHFGYYPEAEDSTRSASGPATRPRRRDRGRGPTTRPSDGPSEAPTSRPARPLVRRDEYDRLSVYFNLDHGTGKIRGVYLEGNEAVRPIFRQWLAAVADLGAQTLSAGRTGGTDHVSFEAVGLPAFQFIQDPIEYWSRTHHSNADVYDRLQAEDLKQASVILATFVYNAAMADEKLPRKPLKERVAPTTTQPEEPIK